MFFPVTAGLMGDDEAVLSSGPCWQFHALYVRISRFG